MTDRELLELAAKAAIIKRYGWNEAMEALCVACLSNGWWNPLKEDAQCARLEAAIPIDVLWSDTFVRVESFSHCDDYSIEEFKNHNGDKQAARRRASTGLAAKIGAALSEKEKLTTQQK